MIIFFLRLSAHDEASDDKRHHLRCAMRRDLLASLTQTSHKRSMNCLASRASSSFLLADNSLYDLKSSGVISFRPSAEHHLRLNKIVLSILSSVERIMSDWRFELSGQNSTHPRSGQCSAVSTGVSENS